MRPLRRFGKQHCCLAGAGTEKLRFSLKMCTQKCRLVHGGTFGNTDRSQGPVFPGGLELRNTWKGLESHCRIVMGCEPVSKRPLEAAMQSGVLSEHLSTVVCGLLQCFLCTDESNIPSIRQMQLLRSCRWQTGFTQKDRERERDCFLAFTAFFVVVVEETVKTIWTWQNHQSLNQLWECLRTSLTINWIIHWRAITKLPPNCLML